MRNRGWREADERLRPWEWVLLGLTLLCLLSGFAPEMPVPAWWSVIFPDLAPALGDGEPPELRWWLWELVKAMCNVQ